MRILVTILLFLFFAGAAKAEPIVVCSEQGALAAVGAWAEEKVPSFSATGCKRENSIEERLFPVWKTVFFFPNFMLAVTFWTSLERPGQVIVITHPIDYGRTANI